MEKELYIISNSPGEMSGWVAPVVTEVRSIMPDVNMTVAIVSDWFSSGKEREFALQLPVNRVAGVNPLIAEIWKNRSVYAAKQSLVLFLGGDALYAKILSGLLRCPAMAYMPRVYHPADFVRIFVPTAKEKERAVRKGAETARVEVVPTLALDSVHPSGSATQVRQRLSLPPEAHPVFSLLAGSRPEYAELGFNFMLDVADLLLAQYADGQILLPVSPFIDRRFVLAVLQQRKMTWSEDPGCETISTGPSARIRFVFGNTHDAFAVTDVAVVIPGTNNLQCAAMGIPFLILMPLNWIEHIPFEGLLGLLYPKFFPFNHLKKWIIAWMSPRIPYMSLVNRMADKMLVQEIRAVLTPADVSGAASELWRDALRREQLRADLLELTRERGAARIIAEAIRDNYISDQRLR